MKDLDTLDAVAEYLSYADRGGAYKWLKKHDVKMVWRGRRLLVRKADVDAELAKRKVGGTLDQARAIARQPRLQKVVG